MRVFAPAKINLFLHVTGRRSDGHHLLDSLVAFADIGDDIIFAPAQKFSFRVHGAAMTTAEDNLVVRAARALESFCAHPMNVDITLIKNLPVASGLGGGSADAAATLRGLRAFFSLPVLEDDLLRIAGDLGADVPACLQGQVARMRGVGEILDPVAAFPAMPLVLMNPGVACSTQAVFKKFSALYGREIPAREWPGEAEPAAWIDFLARQDNVLTSAACALVPVIAETLLLMQAQEGCRLARMSGSGASVFGLFANEIAAQNAARRLQETHPAFWVRAGHVGGVNVAGVNGALAAPACATANPR